MAPRKPTLTTQARRGPRMPLRRERVIEAAMRIADEQGIEALTMRRLARELGVEAMTLYYHVANKDEILVALVDAVLDELVLPSAGGDWKGQLRATALQAHGILDRHAWAAGLMLGMRGVSAARLRYMDAILGALRRAGFDDDQVDHGYHVIEGHIMGFALWEMSMNLGSRSELEGLATSFLAALPPDYAHVADHVRHHLKPPRADDEGSFAFGLDLILDGLDRLPRPAP